MPGQGAARRHAERRRAQRQDPAYRRQEYEAQVERRQQERKPCPRCGVVLIDGRSQQCKGCRNQVRYRVTFYARARRELSTYYANGTNRDFEARVARLYAAEGQGAHEAMARDLAPERFAERAEVAGDG